MGNSLTAQDIDPHTGDTDIETKAAAIKVAELSFTPAETKRLLRKLN